MKYVMVYISIYPIVYTIFVIYHEIYCGICHAMLHGVYIDVYPFWKTENLFHCKAKQSKNSIKPEDYCKKPLFVVDKDSNTYLNEFFF